MDALKDSKKLIGPSLSEISEPDLAKVNYQSSVRSKLEHIWDPIIKGLREIPESRLLNRLNSGWDSSQKEIGNDTQQMIRDNFKKRADKKIENVKLTAIRLASIHGIPNTIQWLKSLI